MSKSKNVIDEKSVRRGYFRKNRNQTMRTAPSTIAHVEGSMFWIVPPIESINSDSRVELPPANAPYSPSPCAINMSHLLSGYRPNSRQRAVGGGGQQEAVSSPLRTTHRRLRTAHCR